MSSDFEKALSAQEEMLTLATKLAAEIEKMPSKRDPDAIRALWARMCYRRSRLSALHRAMRTMGREARINKRTIPMDLQRRIAKETKHLYRRIMKWDHVGDLIERHADPEVTPLIVYPELQEADEMLDLFHMALFDMVKRGSQSNDAKTVGCFADIPMPIRPYEMLLRAAYRLLLIQGRADTAKFLDVGCGGGSKVLAASVYFDVCHGLEYDPEYVAAAEQLFDRTKNAACHVFQGDGRTFDGYDQYDVIYFYRPMREDKLLIEMENQIFETARPGTVVLAPYTTSLSKRIENERPQIGHCIFLAGMSQSEQDAIKYEAERTGTQRISRPQGMRYDAGFWKPIFDVATFNGQV